MNIHARSHQTDEVRAYYRRVLPFYEAELADRGDGDLWTWAASSPAGCRVLEFGAGSGRATAFLARSAGFVVAFDLSLEMIAAARRRLAGASNVVLAVADMREIELRGRFDLVAAVDDPFVHLVEDEDRERAVANVARHLAPGGRFILDAAWFSPDQRWTAAGEGGLIKEHSGTGGLLVHETWHCDPRSRLCTASYAYSRPGEPVERASFPARLWSREELEHRARAAGLRVTHLWGDYDRRPWDRTTSPRMLAELWLAR
ncbi:MAG: class I SAM-dependent methyltransferase [Thermoanaerobaculia bacterium]